MARGLCARCYQRVRRGKEPGPKLKRQKPHVPLTVRVNSNDAKRIEAMAKRLGVSVSELIRRGLRRD
jgi:predicted HicB family RNase H-like nuclease